MVHIRPRGHTGRPLRLYAEVIRLSHPGIEPFLDTVLESQDEYGFTEINHHLFDSTQFLSFADFPKIARQPDEAWLGEYRRRLQKFKSRGMRITLSCSEPRFPDGLFEAYPEMTDVHTGMFWKFLERKTIELFRQIPEMDCYEIHLWEGKVVTDEVPFGDLKWAHYCPNYTPADLLRETLEAYGRAARVAGKEFALMSFMHQPWQDDLIEDAVREMDPNLPVILDHLPHPGDWQPYLHADNRLLERIRGRKATVYYDGAGEYWGQCWMPYCYPDQIQQSLQHVLEINKDIEAVGMRIDWHHGDVYGNPNEVNWYALSKLVKDPYLPIEEIWNGWAESRYGAKAAPAVIRALTRSSDIANLVFYARGTWAACHSSFAGFGYLLSRFMNQAKSVARWCSNDFRVRFWMNDLVNNPREYTIQCLTEDRLEAIRLIDLSLADIESVKAALAPDRYQNLTGQFRLLRHFAEASIPQMASLIRYRMQEQSPSQENLRAIETAWAALEKKATEIDRMYGDRVPMLSSGLIHTYIAEQRQALTAMEKGEPYYKFGRDTE